MLEKMQQKMLTWEAHVQIVHQYEESIIHHEKHDLVFSIRATVAANASYFMHCAKARQIPISFKLGRIPPKDKSVTEQEMFWWQLTPQDSGCVWLPGSVSSWTRRCLNLKVFPMSGLLPIEWQNLSHDCQIPWEKIPFVTVTWFALRPPGAWSLERFLLKACRCISMWSTHLLSVKSLRDYKCQPSQPTCMNK